MAGASREQSARVQRAKRLVDGVLTPEQGREVAGTLAAMVDQEKDDWVKMQIEAYGEQLAMLIQSLESVEET